MKRLRMAVIIVLSLVFALSSCDLWYGIFGDPIVGTWVLTAETVNGTAFTIGTGATDMSMTLDIAKDGTITGGGAFGPSPFTTTGTWTRSGTTYTLIATSTSGGSGTYTGTATYTGPVSSDGKTFTGSVSGAGITSGSATLAKQ